MGKRSEFLNRMAWDSPLVTEDSWLSAADGQTGWVLTWTRMSGGLEPPFGWS